MTSVRVTGPLALAVEFADGTRGTVQIHRTHLTGVFEALADSAFFAQAAVEHGAVTWPGELDLAPDAMYEAIQQSGSWVLR